ncbi:glucosaminidase domain-containing protein [Christiangramia sabulilitoris]|uniref:Peptidoglycan hydrolase n=1 Tax=Christiangramia sabulilitoris TaxID=2583991 RepID=A0A550HZR4_9FLAO|nr:glucosaminidase domain-containing protein [Christiangramia sabulilitoris]TRO64180.1 LysM peptidoglycan-binding domain-containing protein [Christiangramia sabulilitoris]
MKITRILSFVLLIVIAASCGSKKKVVTRKKEEISIDNRGEENRQTPAEVVDDVKEEIPAKTYHYKIEDYIREFAPIAQEEMSLYKIPASITLAQGILESGAGNGDLTRRANNHFGIKCHDWNGQKVYHDDDRRGECFRKYKHARYSYRDHSLFLSGRGRYAFLFDLDADDYKGWAKGLREAGYATDRRYPDKLIDLIERYELYKYDSEITRRPAPAYVEKSRESSGTHVVQKGDTLYSISRKYNTPVEEIKKMNGLNGNTISIGQILSVK